MLDMIKIMINQGKNHQQVKEMVAHGVRLNFNKILNNKRSLEQIWFEIKIKIQIY